MTLEFWFDDLDQAEKEWIANGCGPKGGWFPVPEFGVDHARACCVHDFFYWVGHTEFDRRNADRRFLRTLLMAADEQPWWSRWYYVSMARIYYAAVRILGKGSFYYGPRYRTIGDLRAEMSG